MQTQYFLLLSWQVELWQDSVNPGLHLKKSYINIQGSMGQFCVDFVLNCMDYEMNNTRR